MAIAQPALEEDLRPLRILASAMAGRAVEVVPAASGDRTWTDGHTIFLEEIADGRARQRLLAAQAALIAAGSLAAEVVRELRRHRALADRYLAVEGQRALAANADHLPVWLASMVDHEVGNLSTSPPGSLTLARSRRELVPAWELGAIEPRRVLSAPDEVPSVLFAPRADGEPVDPAGLEELDDTGEGDSTDLGNLLSSPVGGGGSFGRLLARLLRPGRSRDGGGPPGADTPTHRAPRRPGSGRTAVALAAIDLAEAVDPDRPATHRYPEWDERRQRYQPDWCQVVEEPAEADPSASSVLPEPVALRRALARLGTGPVPCRRRRQGEDLDLDALVEARVDHLAGGHGSDDVYLETLRHRRDLSVLVLLDVSGSAAEPGLAGRTVHEHQREAAAALTAVLHGLGDRVALSAFRSRGRSDVQVARIKDFDEPVGGATSQRLHALQPGAYTRLGAAIRHGAAVLEARGGTPRQLLVVLSDGVAYDHGYEGRYGEADARRALLEARRRGIGCLCVSVGAEADLAALPRVFGTAAHATVPSVADLAASIGRLFAAALRSAEVQRRRHQRDARRRVA